MFTGRFTKRLSHHVGVTSLKRTSYVGSRISRIYRHTDFQINPIMPNRSFVNFPGGFDAAKMKKLAQGMKDMPQEQFQAQAKMLKNMTPDQIRTMIPMFKNHTDAQIENHIARLDTLTQNPDMLKQAFNAVEKMTPDEFQAKVEQEMNNKKDVNPPAPEATIVPEAESVATSRMSDASSSTNKKNKHDQHMKRGSSSVKQTRVPPTSGLRSAHEITAEEMERDLGLSNPNTLYNKRAADAAAAQSDQDFTTEQPQKEPFLTEKHHTAPSSAQAPPYLRAGVASLAGIGVLAGLNAMQVADLPTLIGSFGATSALVYGAPMLPVSQPRNAIGGHFVSGVMGVACYQLYLMGMPLEVCLAASVATSVVSMLATKTFHPPAAGNGIILMLGPTSLQNLGLLYPLVPCTLGPIVIVGMGVIANNIGKAKHAPRYPTSWF